MIRWDHCWWVRHFIHWDFRRYVCQIAHAAWRSISLLFYIIRHNAIMFVDDVTLKTVTLAVLDTTRSTNVGTFSWNILIDWLLLNFQGISALFRTILKYTPKYMYIQLKLSVNICYQVCIFVNLSNYPTLHVDTYWNKGTTLLALFYISVTEGSSTMSISCTLKWVWNSP